jgi:hypothetical protein
MSKIFRISATFSSILAFKIGFMHVVLGLLGFWTLGHRVFQKDIQKFGLLHPEMQVRRDTYLVDSKLSVPHIFIINYVFNTPIKYIYTIQNNKYKTIHVLIITFSLDVSVFIAPSSWTAV